jgi:hypothetical protein
MSLQTWQETLITSQLDGTANTTGAAASQLPPQAKFTLPANFFGSIGKQLMLEAWGRISWANPTPGTARFDIRFGATVIFDGLAALLDTVALGTNVGWYLKVLLTCRAVGATGNLFGQGTWSSPALLGVGARPIGHMTAMLPWYTAPAVGNNFDTTATQQVDLFFTQTVATGSCLCHQYSLIALN